MKPVKNDLVKKLRLICKKANKISLFHLAIAISTKHKYFCTSDAYILKKAKVIKKKYDIEVVNDPFVNTSGNSFNYYL